MKKFLFLATFASLIVSCSSLPKKSEVLSVMEKANNYWQANNRAETRPFWDNAAYHTGNLAAYSITNNEDWLAYTKRWAEHNRYRGANSDDRSKWIYTYGERDENVLFGDWQICFQVYADLYNMEPDSQKIGRAREVMEYQMSTPEEDYWWWADGLYMVMPVMTRLYKITSNPLYLEKLYTYFNYAKSIMYDEETGLFFRDTKYVYPKHKSLNGLKDFWARGDGWVLAAFARVLQDLPESDKHRKEFIALYQKQAASVKDSQQPEGYWTRSMLDPEHAPGPETSGTAFFTFGLAWGINNGLLSRKEYLPTVLSAWNYLSTFALQDDGCLGYVQPIGEKAIPGQTLNERSTANFGVGAFLLAASEVYKLAK